MGRALRIAEQVAELGIPFDDDQCTGAQMPDVIHRWNAEVAADEVIVAFVEIVVAFHEDSEGRVGPAAFAVVSVGRKLECERFAGREPLAQSLDVLLLQQIT